MHLDDEDPVACLKAVARKTEVTEEDVKSTYRRFAQRFHPDRGGDAIVFRALEQAYDAALQDVRRRHEEGMVRAEAEWSFGTHSGRSTFEPSIVLGRRGFRSCKAKVVLLAVVFPVILAALVASWYSSQEFEGMPGRQSIPMALSCLFIAGLLTMLALPVGMSRLSPETALLVFFGGLAILIAFAFGGYQHPYGQALVSNLSNGQNLSPRSIYGLGLAGFLGSVVVSTAMGCVQASLKG